MKQRPAFEYNLPSRAAGSLTFLPLGRQAEWVTATWWRFNVAVLSVFIFAAAIFAPVPLESKLLPLVFALPTAVLAYPLMIVMIFVCGFIPVVKVPVGFARIVYYLMFSRLVIQKAPTVHMPLWF